MFKIFEMLFEEEQELSDYQPTIYYACQIKKWDFFKIS